MVCFSSEILNLPVVGAFCIVRIVLNILDGKAGQVCCYCCSYYYYVVASLLRFGEILILLFVFVCEFVCISHFSHWFMVVIWSACLAFRRTILTVLSNYLVKEPLARGQAMAAFNVCCVLYFFFAFLLMFFLEHLALPFISLWLICFLDFQLFVVDVSFDLWLLPLCCFRSAFWSFICSPFLSNQWQTIV